jgi:hypothetical protein
LRQLPGLGWIEPVVCKERTVNRQVVVGKEGEENRARTQGSAEAEQENSDVLLQLDL